jgi:hypothetical protein
MTTEPPPWVDPSVLVPAPVRKSWAIMPVASAYNLAAFMFVGGFVASAVLTKLTGAAMAGVGGIVLLAWLVVGGWWIKRHERKKLAEMKAALESRSGTGSTP